MKLVLAVLLVLTPAMVFGACPNACSGHGSCGDKDMCSCHTNWQGGDCSERICPSNWAWVTTSRGDVNFDGDRFDGTEYQPDYAFEQASAEAQLISQQALSGDWENWPYFAKNGEGHFYMECSNRGLCNRQTGECECFPGYTGAACRRSICPSVTAEECSGHGTCETVGEMAAMASVTYTLWDKDMQRTCLCDAGYTGIACNQRLCPYGDDILTKQQYTETQWVDVKVDKSQNIVAQFAGHIRFKYKDYYGETWTTAWVATSAYAGSAGNLATDAQAALSGLPNNILNDPTNPASVAVSVGYCGHLVDGVVDLSSAYPGSLLETDVEMRCDGSSNICKTSDSGTEWHLANTDTSGGGVAEDCDITAAADTTCWVTTTTIYNCIRYRVDFQDVPGDLNSLEVDTGRVTVSGKNSYQDSTIAPAYATSDERGIVGQTTSIYNTGISNTMTYLSNTQIVTCASDASNTKSGDAGKTLDCSSGGVTNSGSGTYYTNDFVNFGAGELVKVTCGTKVVGYFTIASQSSDSTVTFQETIPSFCDPTAHDIQLALWSLVGIIPGEIDKVLNVGDRITVNGIIFPVVETVPAKITLGSDVVTRVRFSFDGPIIERSVGPSLSVYTNKVSVYGKGTTESNECSDRGLCNRETGICECFNQYTGDACEMQDVLKA